MRFYMLVDVTHTSPQCHKTKPIEEGVHQGHLAIDT
jgi:hypothetical protein